MSGKFHRFPRCDRRFRFDTEFKSKRESLQSSAFRCANVCILSILKRTLRTKERCSLFWSDVNLSIDLWMAYKQFYIFFRFSEKQTMREIRQTGHCTKHTHKRCSFAHEHVRVCKMCENIENKQRNYSKCQFQMRLALIICMNSMNSFFPRFFLLLLFFKLFDTSMNRNNLSTKIGQDTTNIKWIDFSFYFISFHSIFGYRMIISLRLGYTCMWHACKCSQK